MRLAYFRWGSATTIPPSTSCVATSSSIDLLLRSRGIGRAPTAFRQINPFVQPSSVIHRRRSCVCTGWASSEQETIRWEGDRVSVPEASPTPARLHEQGDQGGRRGSPGVDHVLVVRPQARCRPPSAVPVRSTPGRSRGRGTAPSDSRWGSSRRGARPSS